jgi:WD40 repeat protein
LRGKELREAEKQLAEIGSQEGPQPTRIQREYVLAGLRNEERQRRQVTLWLSLGLMLMIFLFIFAWIQRNEAQRQTKITIARQLIAQAQSLFTNGNSHQMTGVLLAIQSMRLFPSDEAAQFLQNNILARPVARMTHGGTVISVAFSPDGKYVVSGSADGTAIVWEAGTGKEIARVLHGYVRFVGFSPDGRYVVSAGCDRPEDFTSYYCTQGSARVWEVSTGKEISRMTNRGVVNSAAFSPDGRSVASAGCDQFAADLGCTQGSARVWELSTGKEVSRMTHDFDTDGVFSHDVQSVAFSPDGRHLISGGNDNTARVWETATGKEISRMTHDNQVEAVTFSHDGRYVASGGGFSTRVWDPATGQEISHVKHGYVHSVAFSPDDRFVVSGGRDSTAFV